jgi:hypothetical protein
VFCAKSVDLIENMRDTILKSAKKRKKMHWFADGSNCARLAGRRSWLGPQKENASDESLAQEDANAVPTIQQEIPICQQQNDKYFWENRSGLYGSRGFSGCSQVSA